MVILLKNQEKTTESLQVQKTLFPIKFLKQLLSFNLAFLKNDKIENKQIFINLPSIKIRVEKN